MPMLRWLTAGESHGPALVAILEGLPAHVEVTSTDISDALARRRLGYGRGARMKFEADEIEVVGGLRHGRTQGGPFAVRIGNSEWPKWETVMSADPVEPSALAAADDVNAEKEIARNRPLTRPRPGHADLVGMQQYGFEDARPVLERASARETAARVALGAVAQAFLRQTVGVEVVSHVVAIGPVVVPDGVLPGPHDNPLIDDDPVRCADPATSVANPQGELHDTPGVWIGDASAFPTATGTNPMITIMALAHRTADNVAAAAGATTQTQTAVA